MNQLTIVACWSREFFQDKGRNLYSIFSGNDPSSEKSFVNTRPPQLFKVSSRRKAIMSSSVSNPATKATDVSIADWYFIGVLSHDIAKPRSYEVWSIYIAFNFSSWLCIQCIIRSNILKGGTQSVVPNLRALLTDLGIQDWSDKSPYQRLYTKIHSFTQKYMVEYFVFKNPYRNEKNTLILKYIKFHNQIWNSFHLWSWYLHEWQSTSV